MSRSGQDEKPFDIPKRLVWQAWKRVAVNGGAPGADGVTIEDFKADLGSNLYKIWNRMSSGTYFPPPVRAAEIPKASGGTRILGVPSRPSPGRRWTPGRRRPSLSWRAPRPGRGRGASTWQAADIPAAAWRLTTLTDST